MSKERYYFDFDKHYVLSYLAKTVLKYNKYVVKIYQKCTYLFDAYSSNHLLDLVKLNSQSVVTNSMLGSNNSPKQSKVSESSEATKQSTSTGVKTISNVSTLQRIPLPIDYAGNEELQDGHKEMDKTEPINLESHCPTRQQTEIVTPKMLGKADSNSKSEDDRKYLNSDTLLFRSMPRIIKSSRGMQIEIYISSLRPENPISTTTSVSLVRSKINKPVAVESIDEDRSPKNAKLSVNEPNPVCSGDISSSAKSSITRSQPVAANAESSIQADVDRGKDHLSYKSPERSNATQISASFSSPSLDILIDCINQLRNLITMREECMKSHYNSLIGFQKCLGYLIIQIENILNVVNHIQMVYKYRVKEDFIKNINGLITMSTILINNIGLMRLDLKKDIKLWNKLFEQIHNIKKLMGLLMLNGKPLVDFEDLRKYEDSLKGKWERIDNTIPILESRMSLFLSTAGDFEKCINLFVKCLINVGVLKLSSTPAL